MARLQAEARYNLATLHNKQHPPPENTQSPRPTESDPLEYTDVQGGSLRGQAIPVGRYHCINEKRPGSLCLSTESVSFETAVSSNQRWTILHRDIQSITKVKYHPNLQCAASTCP